MSELSEREQTIALHFFERGLEEGQDDERGCAIGPDEAFSLAMKNLDAPPAPACPHVWTADEGTSHCTLTGPAPLVWSDGLSFKAFAEANARRSAEAFGHHVGPDCNWTADQWMTAITGELGEAAGALKAINRRQLAKDMDVTEADVVEELADMVTYADLLCTHLGFDLGEAIARKFNKVSARVGSDVRLPEPQEAGE